MSQLTKLKELDISNMYDLLVSFPDQLNEAWDIAMQAEIAKPAHEINNIVVTGMGGSGIGGDLLATLFAQDIDIPIYVNKEYNLPKFVNKNTLLFVCSYSGNTEETISAIKSVKDKAPHTICISSNGTLEKIAKEEGYSLIKVPAGRPPRTALPYLFTATVVAMQKLSIIKDQKKNFEETTTVLKDIIKNIADYNNPENPTVICAQNIVGKAPIIYSGMEPSQALPTRWRNQFSENSKILAFGNLLPEMNHNEIVGWETPTGILDKVHVIFLNDKLNSDRVKARVDITKQILSRFDIPITEFESTGTSRLCRTMSLLIYGDFVSYYLALLNNIDPTPVSNIDFLKGKLAEIE